MKLLLIGIVGFIFGSLALGIVLYISVPSIMIKEDLVPYSFEVAEQKLIESVKKHGWKMPMVHDLQKSMSKAGHSVKPVKVFEICKVEHASEILKSLPR